MVNKEPYQNVRIQKYREALALFDKFINESLGKFKYERLIIPIISQVEF